LEVLRGVVEEAEHGLLGASVDQLPDTLDDVADGARDGTGPDGLDEALAASGSSVRRTRTVGVISAGSLPTPAQ
jgi:hypothetical protein